MKSLKENDQKQRQIMECTNDMDILSGYHIKCEDGYIWITERVLNMVFIK